MIPYIYLSTRKETPATGYWDHALLKDVLSDPIFEEQKSSSTGAICIIPGAYQKVEEINKYIKNFKWAVLIITSDEEHNFEADKVDHKNVKIYIQNPKPGLHDKYNKWPVGYTLETRKYLKLTEKTFDWFFAGQVTHKRREECIEALEKKGGGALLKTKAFSSGINQKSYMEYMNRAKIAPCPAGPVSADSFRVYEALEAGAIPIADNISLAGDKGYWQNLLPEVVFPTINDYSDLPGYIDDQLDNFQEKANKIQAWWIKYKRDLKHKLIDDVYKLTGTKFTHDITVIIPTSSIPSHPDTDILDETINSVRHHLPYAEIILTFDGLRKEFEDRTDTYREYIRRALFKANTVWGNVVPVIFDEFTHQAAMTKKVIEEVKTPLILYLEQDTPLVIDYEIDFKKLSKVIESGESNVIRFHFEAHIPADHKHLMLSSASSDLLNNDLLKTVQWSQRPHLASTIFYKKIMNQYFTDKSRCFIEDLLHGKLYEDYKIHGVLGWNQWRVHIYYPEGNIKRSYHTDGRAGDKKFDDKQKW